MRRRLLIALGLLVVAWLGLTVATLALAASSALEGIDVIEEVRDDASPEALASGAPVEDLRRATDLFASARSRSGSPWVAPLRAVPVVGRQLRSFRTLSGAAEEVSRLAAGAAVDARTILQAGHDTGPARVALLERLAVLAEGTDDSLARVDLGSHDSLVAPLRRRYERLEDEVRQARNGLTRGAAGSRALASLLRGPRRTLVLAANNAEMRAGSGMFLSAGILETADGAIRLSGFTPTSELILPPGRVPVTDDIEARWGWLHPTSDWRNLAASPRFDANAELAAAMWPAVTGEAPVDGVLAVDPVALARVLDAVGPISVSGHRLAGQYAVDFLLRDQYVGADDDPQQASRRDLLGSVAGAALGALQERDWEVGRLASGLADAVAGRHVLAWSPRAEEQRDWERAGVAGRMGEHSLLLAVLNRGGNKLDPYLRVGADLRLRRQANGTEGVLRVDLANRTPTGLSEYAQGPNPHAPTAAGEYLGLVSVTLPAGATRATVDGVDTLAASGRDGPTNVVAAEVRLPRGASRELVVRFHLAADVAFVWLEPTARQPGVAWLVNGARWTERGARYLRW